MKNFSFHRISVLAILLLVLGISVVPAMAQEAMTLPADCEAVSLEFWNPFTGPDGPFMGELVTAFNDSQDQVDVTMATQGEYYSQLTTAAAAGTLPDVLIVHADQAATQAARGIIRPLDEIVTQLGLTGEEFPEAVWNAGQYNDARYTIPLDIHPMTMFVNMDLMTGAGLEAAPTNADEFAAAAQGMTGGDNNGFLITGGFPIRQIFEMLLNQMGGSAFNEDGTEVTWNSEAGVQAMQWLLDAQAAYSQPALEVDAELNAFKGGTVGMIWNGIWQTTNVTGESVFFNGQAVPVPQFGTVPAVWGGSHQFALGASEAADPCVDAGAAMFIDYVLDNSVTWARAGQLPANNAVRESEEFLSVEPQATIAAGSADYVFFPPSVPGITDAYAPLDEAVAALMLGTATDIQAELDSAAERANQILADNRETYGEGEAASS